MKRFPAIIACFGFLGSMAFMPSFGQEPDAGNVWPQFRGPSGRGVALGDKELPLRFGPSKGVLWKTPLPGGVSSPCVWKDHIFLTGFDEIKKSLEVLCIGRPVWNPECVDKP